jgi:hypothetical protein
MTYIVIDPDKNGRFALPQMLAFFHDAVLRIKPTKKCCLTKWALSCQDVRLVVSETQHRCLPDTVTYYPLGLWCDPVNDESEGLLLFSSFDSSRQYYFDVEIEPSEQITSVQLVGFLKNTTKQHVMDLESQADQKMAELLQKYSREPIL